MKKKVVKWPVIGAVIIILALFIYAGNNWVQVTRHTVVIQGLPEAFDGIKIVHIGDLHGKGFGSNNTALARLIKKQSPDLIFVTGDMINSTGDDGGPFINLLEALNGTCPVYCSLGNHEQIVRLKDLGAGIEIYSAFEKRIREAGGILLDNRQVALARGEESVLLYGFTAALYHYSGGNSAFWEGAALTADFVEEKLGRPDRNRFVLLLAHNPKYLDEYAAWGADLVFSGHIHGGVIRLPVWGGLFSPDVSFFPEYDAGLYCRGETTMHVTRGLGNSVIPVRIFNRPEIAVIMLGAK